MSSVVDSETPERESWSSSLLSKLPNKPSPKQQRRLVSLVGSVLVALSAGSNYAFSSFAPQLQESLQLTSTQLNIVGVLGNMGVYLTGPLWGRWVDKQGPKVALMVGALLVLIGYGGQSILYSHSYPTRSAFPPAAFNLLTGIGNGGAFTAAMNAQAKSWSRPQRGSAVAVVLAGFGLSAFMYSTLSHEFFPGNTTDYLRLMAGGSAGSFLLGVLLIRIIMPAQLAAALDQSDAERGRAADATKPKNRRRSSSDLGARAYLLSEDEDEEDDLGSNIEERRRLMGSGSNGKAVDDDGSLEVTGWVLLRQLDFWLLFSIMCLISGAGLLLINNVGTMTRTLWDFNHGADAIAPNSEGGGWLDLLASGFESTNADRSVVSLQSPHWVPRGDNLTDLTYHKHHESDHARIQQEQAHQVSVISLGNAIGRVAFGFLSDLWVAYTGSARYRVWLLLPVTVLAFSSQFLLAMPHTIDTIHKLLIASALTGLAYGCEHACLAVLIIETFGTRFASTNWGILALSSVLSSNIYSVMFGRIYDSHVDPGKGAIHQCLMGEDCYRTSFIVTSVGTAASIVIAMTLIWRRTGFKLRRTMVTAEV